MTDLLDLAQAAKNGFVAKLAADTAVKALGGVYDAVPQNAKPPYFRLGTFETTDASDDKDDDQFETISAEVVCIYQGDARGICFDMAHAVRRAIDRQVIVAPGIKFERAEWLSSSVSDRLPDGVTFAAIVNFELIAQPAG